MYGETQCEKCYQLSLGTRNSEWYRGVANGSLKRRAKLRQSASRYGGVPAQYDSSNPEAGSGTQIAYFYYMDLGGIDRAARATYDSPNLLGGILIDPHTPRAAYWAWAEYAKQEGGVRLVTETNDRCLVALASRHDEEKTVRALVARAKRQTIIDPPEGGIGNSQPGAKPPVKVRIDFEGLPISLVNSQLLRIPARRDAEVNRG